MIQRPSYFNPYGKHVYTVLTDHAKDAIKRGEITSADQLSDDDIIIGLIGRTIGSGAGLYVGGRTDQVLRNMQDQGMIRDEDRTHALAELQTLTFKRDRDDIRAAHFVLQVQRDVQELLGIPEDILEQGGFRIQTTLDWNLQQIAESIVAQRREDTQKRFGASNIALVALSPITREVLAYVGNANFSDDEHQGKIDMVRSPRQPGSSFKAFTYLMAFDSGYGPGSIVYDVPTKFGDDQPQNFDGTFWGPITMRRALAGSRNIPAIKAFFLGGGEEALLRLTRSLGVQTPSLAKAQRRQTSENADYGWPLSIGAAETPLYEMVQGYASIADGGVYRPVTMITKITDQHGGIRYLSKETKPERVVDERSAALVTSILSDVQARPNEYWQSILSVPGFTAAAKTGTSNKCLERDSAKNCTLRRPESLWTIGFTPNLITGVWVGNATSQSLFEKADGLTAAAPIWHDFMVGAHRKISKPIPSFADVSGLAHPLLSRLSGQLASPCTPVELRSSDLLQIERIPSNTEDPACVTARVDKLTNLLASDECPADAAEEQTFFVPRSELPLRWPLWEKGVQDWATKQMELWNKTETHSGSLLKLPVLPTKKCTLKDTPGRLQKPTLTLISPTEREVLPFPSFTPSWTTSGAPIRDIHVMLDDRTVATFTNAPFSGPVRIPRTINSGPHTLTVTLTDMYYNTVKVARQVIVEGVSH